MKIDLEKKFRNLFGDYGDIRCYFAPGRVNLIGEHTDYNGGHVFPCALTLGTYAAARKRGDRKIRFYSMNFDHLGIIETDLEDLIPYEKADWTNYPKGVIWALERNGCKCDKGFDILVYGDIPDGAGLSSSASLEVLTGVVLNDLYGFNISMVDLALAGQYAENHFVGCNCGIMDQFASAMGRKNHAVFLDTNTLEFEYAPIVLEGMKLVIINSKVKHSLVSSSYNERRNECETALKELQKVLNIQSLGDLTEAEFENNKSAILSEIRQKRAKHAVYENQRTIRAVTALKRGDIRLFGTLMNDSHNSLRDDYEVSCEEIDFLVNCAREQEGVIGSRITGGGFGGCTVSIVENEYIDCFKSTIGNKYFEKYGHKAEFYIVDIGEGAGRING